MNPLCEIQWEIFFWSYLCISSGYVLGFLSLFPNPFLSHFCCLWYNFFHVCSPACGWPCPETVRSTTVEVFLHLLTTLWNPLGSSLKTGYFRFYAFLSNQQEWWGSEPGWCSLECPGPLAARLPPPRGGVCSQASSRVSSPSVRNSSAFTRRQPVSRGTSSVATRALTHSEGKCNLCRFGIDSGFGAGLKCREMPKRFQ